MASGTSQVVVVGAGVIGCAVAHELARRGASVRVVDRRDVGQGATQASAGVLAPYITAHVGSALLDLGARSLELYDEFVARAVEGFRLDRSLRSPRDTRACPRREASGNARAGG